MNRKPNISKSVIFAISVCLCLQNISMEPAYFHPLLLSILTNLLTIALRPWLCVAFQTEQSLTHAQLFAAPWTVAHPNPLSWNFPGKDTGVGCHFLLHGLFPTQGLNPGLLHCRRMLYRLSYEGSPSREACNKCD